MTQREPYIITVCLWVAFLLSACHTGHSRLETSGKDSVYTSKYIEGISFEEPEKALALLDTAEERGLLTTFRSQRAALPREPQRTFPLPDGTALCTQSLRRPGGAEVPRQALAVAFLHGGRQPHQRRL